MCKIKPNTLYTNIIIVSYSNISSQKLSNILYNTLVCYVNTIITKCFIVVF